MPESGPVYQPTTVSFEARPSAGGLLAQTTAASSLKMLRKPAAQVSILVVGLVLFAIGVALFASGSADYSDSEQHPGINPDGKVQEERVDIVFITTGGFITLFGLILLGLYVKIADWRRSCVCPCALSKKQGLARQLQGNGGGQILALNPSTDPLVSHTQYAPVSEIPTRQEDEERRNLMPDSKDSCLSSAEESDRMLDTDPRIVLRPIGSTVDDA